MTLGLKLQNVQRIPMDLNTCNVMRQFRILCAFLNDFLQVN